MNMQMMMGEIGESSTYKKESLYPGAKAYPHTTSIIIHRDDHWDRQFAHFAETKKFAERLGITFVTDREDLDLTIKTGRSRAKNWVELSEKLRRENKICLKKREKNEDNVRVMVPADWYSFPRTSPEDTDKTGDELDDLLNLQMQSWSDILVTDLFTGNALVGPPNQALEKLLKEARAQLQVGDPGPEFEKLILTSLQSVKEHDGIILCHDELSMKFILGAVQIASGRKSELYEYFDEAKNLCIYEMEDTHSSNPLADWFLDGNNGEDGERPRYIVGTTATRAIAEQGGGQLYFGTGELTRLARTKIDELRNIKEKETSGEEADYHQLIQSVIKHTTWQLGIAPAQWNQGRNRALVLRLASIGYYTVEYIRSNADEFVRFIRDEVNPRLTSDAEKSQNSVHLNRDSVRTAIRSCYSILKFDEYGTEFYDLDSTTAYSTEHAAYESKSVAGEIYNELFSLRHRTIVHYESLSKIISWLRNKGGYDLNKDQYAREVSTLKDCAWRNYRIMNFYDSARFMAEAAHQLQRVMDTIELTEKSGV